MKRYKVWIRNTDTIEKIDNIELLCSSVSEEAINNLVKTFQKNLSRFNNSLIGLYGCIHENRVCFVYIFNIDESAKFEIIYCDVNEPEIEISENENIYNVI